jgi:hypothetical protein
MIKQFKIVTDPVRTLTIGDLAAVKINSRAPRYLESYDSEGDLILPEYRKSEALQRVLYKLLKHNYAWTIIDNTTSGVDLPNGTVMIVLLRGELSNGERSFNFKF